MSWKKALLIKKACILLLPLIIPHSSRCEIVFNLFSLPLWVESCFCVNHDKISFSRPDFVDSEIVIWGLTSLTDFYRRIHLLFKKRHVENLFCSNNAPEIHNFNSWRHQKLLLVANQLQDSTFFKKINKDIGINKLVSQLKLLPSLFELKELKNTSRNRSLLISEVGKILKLLLLSQATNAESDGIFSALKRVKTYIKWTMGNNRLHALMLEHVHNNILDNINLADVANQFVDKKTDANKHSDIYLRIIY